MSDVSSSNGLTAAGGRPAPHNRGWMWFFAILAVLTVAAIVLQIWFNRHQQLTAQELAGAQSLWGKNGPHDYDFQYTLKKMDSTDDFFVQVRAGKVVSVTRNGEPLEERLYRYSSMPALFGFIEEFMEVDSKPDSPRTFVSATFDPEDGHLLRYVRSVLSKRERQEIVVVRFERVPVKVSILPDAVR